MKGYTRRLCMLSGLLLVLLGLTVSTGYAQPQTQEKISAPGQYSGYSSPQYDNYTTTSQYVTARDGVRLAVDVYIPTGGPPQEKWPTILIMTPYHRASVKADGTITSYVSNPKGEYRFVMSYGYAFVVADIRGTGASFGYRPTIFAPEEQEDANDLLNWIAAQPWSDGNVGMMSQSYLGTIEYLAAAHGNSHLKCIVPRYATFDLYDLAYPGGLLDQVALASYKLTIDYLDANKAVPDYPSPIWPSKPVDEDKDGSLLAQATEEHKKNFDISEAVKLAPFRDSTFTSGDGSILGYRDSDPAGHLQQIENSGVAIYNMAGWLDAYPRDMLTMQATLPNFGKMLIGPYFHNQKFENSGLERVRFFDWCLKGIDNGIDKEPPYYIGTGGTNTWRFADQWPLPEQQLTPYYFGSGNSITTVKPTEASAFDEYLTDYTSTTETAGRWACTGGYTCYYPERSELDKKNLIYTTPPLQHDLEVTGHPVVHLFASSTATDGAFFVYLEDIDENGAVNYVTEGQLKASLRKLSPRPWKPDLPWHRSYAEDAAPLTPGQVEELVFDMNPTSYMFLKGHRLRFSIAGWDNNDFGGPQFDPPPTISMYRDSTHASYVELPIIGKVAQITPAPSAPAGVVVLPSTGSGPEDGGFQWTPVVWLLVGGAGAAALAGGLCIQFASASRRAGGR